MFKYILLALFISTNAFAQSDIGQTREIIGNSLNNAVNEIKVLLKDSKSSLGEAETNDEENKVKLETLEQKASASETNPTVLNHAKKAIPACDYKNNNLIWNGNKWECVKMSVSTECQAPAPDEYMYLDENGNNVCAKSPKGSNINYYYVFRNYSSKCIGAHSGHEKLYDCVYKNKLGQVIDVAASNCSGKSKPNVANKLCAKNWTVGSWGSCSKTCGGGTQSRSVTCQAGYDCSSYKKPASTQSCNTQKCKADWVTGSWSSCSATACGTKGTQTRSVYCPANKDCSHKAKPAAKQNCSAAACVPCTWKASSWSSCSVTACGSKGTQTRSVTTTGPAGCIAPTTPKPATTQACSTPACKYCTWSTGSWSACSATACGTRGSQTRSVWKSGPSGCVGPTTVQPATSQACSAPACKFKSCSQFSWSVIECGKHHGVVRSRSSNNAHGTTENVGVISTVDRKYEVDFTIKCNNGSWQKIGSTKLFNYQTGASYKCNAEQPKSYIWMKHNWGTCSKLCGGGRQYRTVNCVEISNPSRPVVSDTICHTKLGTKPTTYQSCNPQACVRYYWHQGSYGACSNKCGNGTKYRTVYCKGSDGRRYSDSKCSGKKPSTSSSCRGDGNKYECGWGEGGR